MSNVFRELSETRHRPSDRHRVQCVRELLAAFSVSVLSACSTGASTANSSVAEPKITATAIQFAADHPIENVITE